MNFIVVMNDTLRADHLGCYGNEWIHTPNFDRLAAEGAVFERAYAASFPTIPNRTDLLTGRYGEPLHPWLPLAWDAVTLPEALAEAGYVTQLINDTPHLINAGHGFDRPFHAWVMIRGNEVDRFRLDTKPLDLPTKNVAKIKPRPTNLTLAQYLRNVRERRNEEDYFPAQTIKAAIRWLEDNRDRERFLLWIDCFDPHEPWDPPQHYVDLYDPGYRGEVIIMFPRSLEVLTPAERRHICALYAGEVSLVDRWLGELLDAVDRLGLRENTAIIATSDHGTYLGEHGQIMTKSTPLYEPVARIPLIIRLPDGTAAGRRFSALAQPPDLMPTLLELAGVPVPECVQGRSLVPVLRGETEELREFAFSGGAPNAQRETACITVHDGRWAMHVFPQRERWELYDLRRDREQRKNVVAQHPRVAQRLHAAVVRFLREHEAQPQVVRWFETGDKGDMTGYRFCDPYLEKFWFYWQKIARTDLVPE